jgi:two-component system sensor histidine kinase TctE
VLDEEDKPTSGGVRFRNDSMHGTPVRIAYAYVQLERKPGAEAPLALVQVAETLENAPSWPTKSSRA